MMRTQSKVLGIGRAARPLFAISILAVVAPFGVRAQAALEGLGTLSGWDESAGVALTANGQGVTGLLNNSADPGLDRVFYWTRGGGMVDLGTLGGDYAVVHGSQSISDDGEVIVGTTSDAEGAVIAFRWTPEGGMQDLGALSEDNPFAAAYAVSGSGATAFGASFNDVGALRGFVWTAGGGMVQANSFGAMDSGFVTARLTDTEYLGVETTAVEDGVVSRAVLLTSTTSALLESPEGNFTIATAASPLANAAVGHTTSDAGNGLRKAVVWSMIDRQIHDLDAFDGFAQSEALGIAANGAVTVGRAFDGASPDSAVMWTNFGHHEIADFLERYYGMDLSGWDGLRSASGVVETSPNRYSIAGTGERGGLREAFLVSDLNVVQSRWLDDPAGNAWTGDGNWDNGAPFDIGDAVFGPSTVTDISIASSVEVATIRLLPDADPYTFTVEAGGLLSVGGGYTGVATGLENHSIYNPLLVIEAGGMFQALNQARFDRMDLHVRGMALWTSQSGASFSGILIENGGLLQAVADNEFSFSAFWIDAGGRMEVHAPVAFLDSYVLADGGEFFATSDALWSGSEIHASFGGVVHFVAGGLGDSVVNLHDGGILRLGGNSHGADAQITVQDTGSTLFVQDGATAGGATVKAGAGGSVVFRDGGAGEDAAITLHAGGTIDITGTGRPSVPVGSLAGSGSVELGDKTLEVGALGGSTTFDGTIAGEGGVLVKVGAGTLALGGANTHTGGTQALGGLLEIGANSALGAPAAPLLLDGGGIRYGAAFDTLRTFGIGAAGATIDTNGFDVTFSHGLTGPGGAVTFGGLTKTGEGTLRLTGMNIYRGGTVLEDGAIEIAGTGRFPGIGNIVNHGVIIFNRSIEYPMNTSISGSGAIVKQGDHYLRLVGNSFSGGAILESGRVELNGVNALGSGTVSLRGGTLRSFGSERTLANAIVVEGGFGVDGSLALTFDGAFTLTGDHALSITNSALTTIGGPIGEAEGEAGVLRKTGGGVLRVTGENTFSGGTVVDAGTLLVDSASGLGSGDVFIAAGATLGGSGSFTGDLTLDGTIAPGASPGTLATGAQTWNGGGSYIWEINDATGAQGANPGWDWLDITGALTIHSTVENPYVIAVTSLTLDDHPGAAANFDPAQTYTWILATASGGIDGFGADRFSIDTSAFSNAPGSDRFSITSDGMNLSLTYSAVPEPAAYGVVLGLGLLALAMRHRRR